MSRPTSRIKRRCPRWQRSRIGLWVLEDRALALDVMGVGFSSGSVPSAPPSTPGILDNLTFDRWVAPTAAEDPSYSGTNGVASGPGSFTAPWSMAYAAAGGGGNIASDVARSSPNNHCYIGVRGGTYHITSQYNFVNACSGTLGSGVDAKDGKVIFRAQYGERVVVTGGDGGNHSFDILRHVANYCWICYFEVYWSTWTVRSAAPLHVVGFYQSQGTVGGSKFIHCIGHDLDNGFTAEYWNNPLEEGEFYGNIAYTNGLNNSSPGGNGHGYYCRHDTDSSSNTTNGSNLDVYLNIRLGISFDQFGLNYQIYDQSAGLNHIRVEDCIGFNGGMRSTAGTGGQEFVAWTPNTATHHMAYRRNRFYKGASDNGECMDDIGKAGDAGHDIEISDNYCVSDGGGICYRVLSNMSPQSTFSFLRNLGRSGSLVEVDETGTLGYVWRQNDWHRSSLAAGFSPGTSWTAFKTTTSLGTEAGFVDTASTSDPAGTQVFVIPANKYEGGRAHICYYDWANLNVSLGYIPADVSAVLNTGDNYALYDVRDLVNPVQTGTYTGVPIHLPITQLSPSTPGGTSGTGLTPPQTAPFFNVFVLRRT